MGHTRMPSVRTLSTSQRLCLVSTSRLIPSDTCKDNHHCPELPTSAVLQIQTVLIGYVCPTCHQGLATLAWSVMELQLAPPPAWMYCYVGAARTALPSMSALDLGQVVRSLQRHNATAALSKVDDFLLDALDALGAMGECAAQPGFDSLMFVL